MRFLTLLSCILILLVAFALGLWRLDAESIWHDEAWSIRAIQSPFGTPDDNTPPLYYFTLHLLQKLGAGDSPFALRYGSVLLHLLTVAFGFRIGCRWYGLTAGVTAGTLLALSPLLWEYAQEVRAYAAVPLIALALLAGTEAFLKPRNFIPIRGWIFLLAVELAGLYTHNLSVPVVAWMNGVILTVLVWRIFRLQPFNLFTGRVTDNVLPQKKTRTPLTTLFLWLVIQIVLFLLYLPWLLTQSPSGTSLNTVPKFNRELLENIWQAYFFPVIASDLPDSLILKLQILAAISIFAGLILLWQGKSLKTLLIVSQVILLPIFSTLLIIRASIDFHPRYYVLSLPALLLLLAAAIHTLPYKAWIAAIFIIFAGLITRQSLSLIAENRRYQHDDFAAMADHYATLPPDALILIPYDREYTFQVVFKDGIQADFLTIPLHSSPEKAIEKINAALDGKTHLELLIWFQLPADERGMYSCLLSAASDRILETHEVYGLSSTGYEISQPIQLQSLETDANFNSALRLTGVNYAESPQGICVQSTWKLERAPEAPVYHAAARIINPFGWEIAAADGLILRDDQARVENWKIGDSGAAFTFLQLPPGVPEMLYEMLLRLYTPQNLSGFDAVNPEGESLGKDVRLPEIVLQGESFRPENVHVTRDNTGSGVIYSGQRLQIEMISSESGELILAGESWEISENIHEGLNWIEFIIPDEAEGEAVLKFNDEPLKTYTVLKTERLFTAPDFEISIGKEFQGVAVLIGATVTQTDEQIQVELIWQATDTPDTDYKVFVQALGENGLPVAQDDTMPVNGQHPTTGWIAGEYIQDSHILHLNGLKYNRLIVGLYNPMTAERVLLLDGSDFAEIPIE